MNDQVLQASSVNDDRFMTFRERDCAMETVEDRQWKGDADLVENGRRERERLESAGTGAIEHLKLRLAIGGLSNLKREGLLR